MRPTTDFRWATCHRSVVGWTRPSALAVSGDRVMVLQQRWTSDLNCVPDEWRDIPMFELEEPRYTITEKGKTMLRDKA